MWGKGRVKGHHNITSEWNTGMLDIVAVFPTSFPLTPRCEHPWPHPSLVTETASGEFGLRAIV